MHDGETATSGKRTGTRLRTASTRLLTRFLNPVGHRRLIHCDADPPKRSSEAGSLATRSCANAPRDRGGGVLCRPESGSDQRRNGTQDVNDPASRPARRPHGRFGVVHVLGSACRTSEPMSGSCAAHPWRLAAGNCAGKRPRFEHSRHGTLSRPSVRPGAEYTTRKSYGKFRLRARYLR